MGGIGRRRFMDPKEPDKTFMVRGSSFAIAFMIAVCQEHDMGKETER